MIKIAKMYHPYIEGRDIIRVMQEYYPELSATELTMKLYEAFGIKDKNVVGAIPFQMPSNPNAIIKYYGDDTFISSFIEILRKDANIYYNDIVFINMPV